MGYLYINDLKTLANMKTKLQLSLFALTLSLAGVAQTVHPDYMDGVIWVKVSDQSVQKNSISIDGGIQKKGWTLNDLSFSDVLQRYGITSVRQPFHNIEDKRLKNVVRVEFSNYSDVDQILKSLNGRSDIEYAEKAPLLKKTLTPNDPSFNASTQWGLYQINAPTAWNVSTGSSSVVVAIVDDAVEITHPDLSPVIWTNTGEIPNNGIDDDGNGYIDDVNGFDVADSDNDPNPDSPVSSYDHGTHVAGIAGAASNNNIGVASIGYGISLMAVKSTTSASAVTHGYEGVVYAVESGADVINMSWGGSGSSTTYQNIMSWAYGQGVVLIAAAGNDNVSSTFYPAGYNNVISVASTTTGDAKSGFSNYGSWIDISAPGSAIYSTVPNGGYAYKQGTSMASPMVAGLAGLMLSLNPGLTPADIETCILTTADNIDAANPSYIGDLGAGRINAQAAMNCITATLNYPPQAEFQGIPTVILEGQTVSFTDMSVYNPTSWSWTFTGGTPSTFNGQNPGPITYNTAGTYQVSLTVTNANGNDTETKTGYITVNGLTGCDTISNTLPSDVISIISWTGGNGYVNGHNAYGMTRFAEQYSAFGPTWVTGAEFYFAEGETNNPSSYLTVFVWANSGGFPGAVLYQEDISMQEIEDNVTGPGPGSFYITNVDFDLPVQVTGSDFFVGYSIENATHSSDSASIGMVNVTSDATRPNRTMVYFEAGNPLLYPVGWESIETVSTAQFLMHIYPRISQTPPTAIIQANPNPACEGDFMNFDGTSSPNATNWEWAINGTGTPYPTGGTPSVVMSQAGNHMVYMAAYNSCGFYHIDSMQVTVDATPNVSVISTTDTICPGGSATFTASGASSYTWTPGGTLSCTNCTGPVATPSSTTTYTVTGTTGNCSAFSDYTIIVDDSTPIADFLASNDTICEGESITYNGAISSSASTFAWTFTGGDISSSSSANPTVVYNTAGTYNVDLTVNNTCSLSDNTSGQVVVLSAAVCNVGVNDINEVVFINYNAIDSELTIDLSQLNTSSKLTLIGANGQLIDQINNVAPGTSQLNVANLSAGVYMLIVETNGNRMVHKFVK